MIRLCRCGHNRDAHEHYRGGSDCGHCLCPRWRWRSVVRRVDAVKGAAREKTGVTPGEL